MLSTNISEKVIKTDAQIIGHEYYSIMGIRLPREPQKGLFIHRMLKEDGTSEIVKEFKIREY